MLALSMCGCKDAKISINLKMPLRRIKVWHIKRVSNVNLIKMAATKNVLLFLSPETNMTY